MDNTTLQVIDGAITVDTINVTTLTGHAVRGDVKVYGVVDAAEIRTTELYVHKKYDKQYLEFANPTGEAIGTGLLWTGGPYNRQLVLQTNPDRLYTTENLDVAGNRAYLINGQVALSGDSLGKGVVNSNLQTLGTLRSLTVGGNVNIGDTVFFNPVSQRVSIGTQDANGALTIFDTNSGVELILSGDGNGNGIIGTYNTKTLNIITDSQKRATFYQNGDITLGVEGSDSNTTRMYGTVGIGVKNPSVQLEVAGDIKFNNKLMTTEDGIPTNGNYSRGDIVWNRSPKANSFVGWVCVLGGNPGQWLGFGAIVAN